MDRGNHFNLLRLLFACLVIISHGPEIVYGDRSHELLTLLFGTLSFGEFAVDGFFLLSGYLIVKSWESRPEPGAFLANRARRIVPGFVVCALVCAFVVGPVASEAGYFSRFWWKGFAASVVTLTEPMIPEVFAGTYYPQVNGSLWTIRYEVLCYLGVLMFGLLGGFRVRMAWLVLTGAFIVLFMLGRFDAWPLAGKTGQKLARLFMLFGIGGCYFLYARHILAKPGLAAAAAFILAFAFSSAQWAELCLGVFGGYLILSVAVSKASALAWFNRLPDVSYGVYLYAWPITKLLLWGWPDLSATMVCLLTLLGSLVAGTLSWYLIERPFMQGALSLQPQRPVTAPLKA